MWLVRSFYPFKRWHSQVDTGKEHNTAKSCVILDKGHLSSKWALLMTLLVLECAHNIIVFYLQVWDKENGPCDWRSSPWPAGYLQEKGLFQLEGHDPLPGRRWNLCIEGSFPDNLKITTSAHFTTSRHRHWSFHSLCCRNSCSRH